MKRCFSWWSKLRQRRAAVDLARFEEELVQLQELVYQLRRRVAVMRLQDDDSICPTTLEPHVYVQFASNPRESRLVCHDCDKPAEIDDVLYRPHGRSSLGSYP